MNFFSRSSRPTGPKMRVARGSPWSVMSTAAFSSNRMYDPSRRRVSLAVRTTPARHLALLDLTRRDGVLDGHDDDVAEPRVAALRSAEHPDHERVPRPRVVGDLEDRLLLHHARLPSLPRALEDLDHAPPLGLGKRPGLDDPHGVAGPGPLLVVGGDLLGPDHLLAVEPVRKPALQRHRHGLLHLGAHHHAGAHLAPPPHARVLSARMVLIRAISRRRVRSASGLGIASVARRKASRKRSSTSTASWRSSSSVLSSRKAAGFFVAI